MISPYQNTDMEVFENTGTWCVCSPCTRPNTSSEAIGHKKLQGKKSVKAFSRNVMLRLDQPAIFRTKFSIPHIKSRAYDPSSL